MRCAVIGMGRSTESTSIAIRSLSDAVLHLFGARPVGEDPVERAIKMLHPPQNVRGMHIMRIVAVTLSALLSGCACAYLTCRRRKRIQSLSDHPLRSEASCMGSTGCGSPSLQGVSSAASISEIGDSSVSRDTSLTLKLGELSLTFGDASQIDRLPPEWKDFFRAAGVKRRDLEDKDTARFIVETINAMPHAHLSDAVGSGSNQEGQKVQSGVATPPHLTDPCPPTHPNAQHLSPPSLAQGLPPPPPPPPPPTPFSQPGAGKDSTLSRKTAADLMNQIREGNISLKTPACDAESSTTKSEAQGFAASLQLIRQGAVQLKHVDTTASAITSFQNEATGSIASALKKRLAERKQAIEGDVEPREDDTAEWT